MPHFLLLSLSLSLSLSLFLCFSLSLGSNRYNSLPGQPSALHKYKHKHTFIHTTTFSKTLVLSYLCTRPFFLFTLNFCFLPAQSFGWISIPTLNLHCSRLGRGHCVHFKLVEAHFPWTAKGCLSIAMKWCRGQWKERFAIKAPELKLRVYSNLA